MWRARRVRRLTSKTLTNRRPTRFRFSSGSVTPSSAARKRSEASTALTSTVPPSRRSTSSVSPVRSSPLSTKMPRNRSPTARWTSSAATAESTPPDTAPITRASGPTRSRTRCTSVSSTCSVVQRHATPQTVSAKWRSIRTPPFVCVTSGWNCSPYMRGPAMAAHSQLAELAVTSNPGGSSATRSPCDIHTSCAPSVPRTEPSTTALPYSRRPHGSTRPPKACASSCMP